MVAECSASGSDDSLLGVQAEIKSEKEEKSDHITHPALLIAELELIHNSGQAMESKVYVIVDFDNFYINLQGIHDDALHDRMRSEIRAMLRQALAASEKATEVIVRLYGGWMEENLLTNWGSRVMQAVSSIGLFPLLSMEEGRVIRGSIDLARTLLNEDSATLGHTRKTRNGLPQLQLSHHPKPIGCLNDIDRCPLVIMNKFTKTKAKKCPVVGCKVTNRDAFVVIEQKMVDVMMSCDIATLCLLHDQAVMVVMSDDLDIIPPLLAFPKINGTRCTLIIQSQPDQNPYYTELVSRGINIKRWSSQ